MRAKSFLSAAFKYSLLAVVAAFLALHSINLFRFVFPVDQQYLAVLGFGLTGFGAIAYLLMFLWDNATVLQRSVSLAMAVICSIGEVAAALFGMQIESWSKAGFTLTENDFQTMLLVIGFLSIAHFIALITYFAGDKIGELFQDQDGDGVPNFADRDYKSKQNKSSSNHQKQQKPQPQTNQRKWWTADDLFAEMGMSAATAKGQWDGVTYQQFASDVSKAVDISGKNMRQIFDQTFPNPTPAARGNGKNP